MVKFDVSDCIDQVLKILEDNLNHSNLKVKVSYQGFLDGTRVETDKNRFQ